MTLQFDLDEWMSAYEAAVAYETECEIRARIWDRLLALNDMLATVGARWDVVLRASDLREAVLGTQS